MKKEVLEQIVLNNEYGVQHTMYAVIKALYLSARREINQDIGYGTDRYDILIEEIDTVIEIKCTRKDHSENKLFRELGENAFFYWCSKLIIYVYDKQHVVYDRAMALVYEKNIFHISEHFIKELKDKEKVARVESDCKGYWKIQ